MTSTIKIMGGDGMHDNTQILESKLKDALQTYDIQLLEAKLEDIKKEMKEDKLIIRVLVYTTKIGTYKLEMYVVDANDGYTENVFVKNVDDETYHVRGLTESDSYIDEKTYNENYRELITKKYEYESDKLEVVF